MPPGVGLTANGFTVKGLLRTQSVPWPSLVACTATVSPMELLYRDPAETDGFGKAQVPFGRALELLRSPLFPRLTLSVRGAKKVGLLDGEAQSFGPPAETKWFGPGPDEKTALGLLGKVPVEDEFVAADRVGTWSGGVAFDLGEEEGRTLPWDLLAPWSKPAVEGCFRFHWPPSGSGAFEGFLVTVAQARYVLGYPSGRSWDMSLEVRRSLGLA